jgi:hypothetical protein
MSEIKVGDFVNCYGILPDNILRFLVYKGVVVNVRRDLLDVKFNEDIFIFPFPKNTFTLCRKQCRKLVKVKKCDACAGSGEVNDFIELCTGNKSCTKCHGNGKVKCQ